MASRRNVVYNSSSPRQSSMLTFLLGFITALVLLRFLPNHNQHNIPPDVLQALSAPQSTFQGSQYWKEGVTQKVTTLYQSKFARFQLHQVLLPDGTTVVHDWMWYDEADNINVLVETAQGTYLVFQQTKYAFADGDSYAVVGGLIEPGEEPLEAAQRELKEELGLESSQWTFLKSFRAAANRGGGTTFCFVAHKATPVTTKGMADTSPVMMAEGESELQTRKELTRNELIEALLQGKFQEIKWTATVALALLSE